MNWYKALTALSFLAVSCGGPAQAQSAPSPFSPVQFLVGDWVGGGSTDVGQATGRSSIKADLGGHVLVRRDHTDIPAAEGRPASSMEVLMLIYPQASDGRLHATYTVSGGHVIQYTALRVEPGRLVEFDSDPSPSAPTFRLTYSLSRPEDAWGEVRDGRAWCCLGVPPRGGRDVATFGKKTRPRGGRWGHTNSPKERGMSDRQARVNRTLSEPEIRAFFERTQKAQDAIMAVVGDKRRVGGEIACPVCGNGTLSYFVHEDHWDAPHNAGECSTAECVNWTM